MSLPKYPAYKDSGVEWVGDVPSGWVVDRLKASIISCKNGVWGQDALQDENDIPCVRVADFDRQKLSVSLQEPTIRNVLQKDRNERVLTKNNLLLEKSGGGENQLVGCVVLYEDENPAVCSNFVAKITIAPNMSPSYWRYVHFAIYSVRLNYCSIKQTSGIQNLDQDSYFNEKAPFPSFQEQTLIAQFLDRETTKIDDLIVEQDKLISLLDEQRQAMISHAVTKGLNPDAPMKDSGVEWLGEVPEDWQLIAIKRIGTIKYGIGEPPSYQEEGVPLVRATNVDAGQITKKGLVFVDPNDIPEKRIVWLQDKDIIVVRSGAYTGDSAIITTEYINAIAGFDMVLTIKNNDAKFIQYCLLSNYLKNAQLDLKKLRAAQPHLNAEELGESWVVLPSLSEQTSIVKYLDKKTAQLDTLKAEAQRGIDLLKERRSALISAAVTGKIDVRHAVTEQVAT